MRGVGRRCLDTSFSDRAGHSRHPEPVTVPLGLRIFGGRRVTSRVARGQALVEFAFVFPLFLLILFAGIDGGRWVFTQNNLNEASREAARAVAVETRPPECLAADARDVCAAKVVAARVFATGGPWTTTTTCYRWLSGVKTTITIATCDTGDYIAVDVIVSPWQVLTPFLGQFLAPSIEGRTETQVIR